MLRNKNRVDKQRRCAKHRTLTKNSAACAVAPVTGLWVLARRRSLACGRIAKRLVPFHFSPRYSGRSEDIPGEAQAAFAG